MPGIIAEQLHKEQEFLTNLKTRIELMERSQKAITAISCNLLFFIVTVFAVWHFAYLRGLNAPVYVICSDFDSSCYKMRNGLKDVDRSQKKRNNPRLSN